MLTRKDCAQSFSSKIYLSCKRCIWFGDLKSFCSFIVSLNILTKWYDTIYDMIYNIIYWTWDEGGNKSWTLKNIVSLLVGGSCTFGATSLEVWAIIAFIFNSRSYQICVVDMHDPVD